MDEQIILDAYSSGEKQKMPTLQLDSGETVVGTEVDEHNHLYYVIEGEKGLRLDRAEGMTVATMLREPESVEVHVTNAKNISLPDAPAT